MRMFPETLGTRSLKEQYFFSFLSLLARALPRHTMLALKHFRWSDGVRSRRRREARSAGTPIIEDSKERQRRTRRHGNAASFRTTMSRGIRLWVPAILVSCNGCLLKDASWECTFIQKTSVRAPFDSSCRVPFALWGTHFILFRKLIHISAPVNGELPAVPRTVSFAGVPVFSCLSLPTREQEISGESLKPEFTSASEFL